MTKCACCHSQKTRSVFFANKFIRFFKLFPLSSFSYRTPFSRSLTNNAIWCLIELLYGIRETFHVEERIGVVLTPFEDRTESH